MDMRSIRAEDLLPAPLPAHRTGQRAHGSYPAVPKRTMPSQDPVAGERLRAHQAPVVTVSGALSSAAWLAHDLAGGAARNGSPQNGRAPAMAAEAYRATADLTVAFLGPYPVDIRV